MNPAFIVLTDFFAVSERALAYTTDLAAVRQARVVLLHVCHPSLHGSSGQGSPRTAWNKQQKQRELTQLAGAQALPLELVVSKELFPDAVRQTVRAQQGQLLVLGQPGATEQPVEVVTSVAMDLLEQALCPVLVVPAATGLVMAPCRLLLAIDGQPFDLHPVPLLVRQLLADPQTTLEVVFITESRQSRPDPVAVLNTLHINDVVPPVPVGHLHLRHTPDVAAGILGEVARLEADMLVVVARRHSLIGSLFHESITAQLLEQSPVPVLALPARD